MEGLAEVQKALRDVIFPHLQNADADQTYGNGISQPLNAPAQPDAVDPRSIDVLRDNLVLGEREKAVWGAVDNRLWGHAMIIASSLDKALWKQVVQEFVRREVKSATSNTESLAALYEIFAGNVEESVDELVPPSARAGLQMVSTVNGQESSKNALDGLDSWKDTLGMVLSNRSPEDYQALLALGRLLLSYGRVEAAHICMIFSRAALFGGADDPQASIVLLGANHQHFPSTFMHDEDAILLTEVYEFATSILASLPQATLPHLTGFKLQYAWTLADRDRKSEAQQYCDAIAAALKASTRPSGYYHQHLFTTLGELSARLSQTTADGARPGSRNLAWRRSLGLCGLDSTVLSRVRIVMRRLRGPGKMQMQMSDLLPRLLARQLSAVRRRCRICTVPIRVLGRSPSLHMVRHGITRPTASTHETRHPSISVADRRWIRRDRLDFHLVDAGPRSLPRRVRIITTPAGHCIIHHWPAINLRHLKHLTCLSHLSRKTCPPSQRCRLARCRHRLLPGRRTSHQCIHRKRIHNPSATRLLPIRRSRLLDICLLMLIAMDPPLTR